MCPVRLGESVASPVLHEVRHGSVRVIYPVRCPVCRGRLTCRRWMPLWVRWCRKCRMAVSYTLGHEMFDESIVISMFDEEGIV